MRNLHDIIEKMIQVIPKDLKYLTAKLQQIQQSVRCATPEMMSFWWEQTYETLKEYVYNKQIEGWREDVRKIFTNE